MGELPFIDAQYNDKSNFPRNRRGRHPPKRGRGSRLNPGIRRFRKNAICITASTLTLFPLGTAVGRGVFPLNRRGWQFPYREDSQMRFREYPIGVHLGIRLSRGGTF